ncbi:MAG: hypothetical protein ACUVXB_08015 [Bryobacteraceae bacterium]
MRKLMFALCVALLLAVTAAPLSAQTLLLRANVPFEFYLNGKVMPAGEYQIDTKLGHGIVRVWKLDSDRAVLALAQKDSFPYRASREEAVVVFHRYGDRYFLSHVRDGFGGLQYRMLTSRAEAEFQERAAVRDPDETVLIAARLVR